MDYRSQWQQDKILYEEFFSKQKSGIFVDVGAHDGVTFSNTYFLNKNGWVGLCIEPIEERYNELVNNRPDCIPINGCAYNREGTIQFSRIDGYSEMLSGISECYPNEHISRIQHELKLMGGGIEIQTKQCFTLKRLCDLYGIDHISYLTIDTEGSELEILEGLGDIKVDVIDVEENYDSQKIRTFLEKKGFRYYNTIGGDSIYLS